MKPTEHIFITGGASGLGKELARSYLAQGASVSLFDIQDGAAATQELCASTGCNPEAIRFYELDVTNEQMVEQVFASAAAAHSPDTVVNCAGVTQAVAFVDDPAEAFNRIVTINLFGSRHVAAAAVKYLPDGGHLVLYGSMAAIVACYGYTAYSASKFGVRGLAEVLRVELKPRDIAVSLVCPPEVETPMVEKERINRPEITSAMKMVAGHLSVEDATRRIFAALPSRRFLIVVGAKARLLTLVTRLVPDFINHWVTDMIMRRLSRKG